MCEPMGELRLETLDVKDRDAVQAVIDAAYAAAASACCLQRKNAVSLAVFDAAHDAGLRVAWGDILDDDGPDFLLWPRETWHRHTVAGWLDEHRANEISGADAARMRANLPGAPAPADETEEAR